MTQSDLQSLNNMYKPIVHMKNHQKMETVHLPNDEPADCGNYDAYDAYIANNGLTRTVMTKQKKHYVHIDSKNRNPTGTLNILKRIPLSTDPLYIYENKLRIYMTNTKEIELANQVRVNGICETEIILRNSIDNVDSVIFTMGQDTVKFLAPNNMNFGKQLSYEPAITIDTTLSEFVGDTEKIWFFNFKNFTVTCNQNLITITENVHADKQMLIGWCKLDTGGHVTEVNTHQELFEVLQWENNNVIQTMPDEYIVMGNAFLQPTDMFVFPISFYDFVAYIQNIQNILRPIFSSYVNTIGSVFSQLNPTYATQVNFLITTSFVNTLPTIGNIPVNYMNQTHNMLLSADNNSVENVFYIKLDREYTPASFEYAIDNATNLVTFKEISTAISNIHIVHHHYGGLPIKNIVDTTCLVTLIEDNKYIEIEHNTNGYYYSRFGGNNLFLHVVDGTDQTSTPDKYTINLGKIYTNISEIRVIESIFPNNKMIIYDGRNGGKKNNMFYWQNIDDGEYIYSVSFDNLYTCDTEQFKRLFETSVANVYRYNGSQLTSIPNKMTLNIDTSANQTSISSFGTYTCRDIIVAYFDIAGLNAMNNVDAENLYYLYPSGEYYKNNNVFGGYRIKIKHKLHGLNAGTKIIISGSTDVDILPAKHINKEHTINRIIDKDHYDIVLPPTINTTTSSNLGGSDITITFPIKFRLRFDYAHTICNVIGFSPSCTPYNYTITSEKYLGKILAGYSYLLIKSNELTSVFSNTTDYFCKIELNNYYNRDNDMFLYNTFVCTPIQYVDPIKKLHELSIKCVTPNNEQYDFDGENHSFTLEITTNEEMPLKSHLKT